VFWKYLSDSAAPGRLESDPSIVREVWETARPENVYSTLALRRVLEAHGRTVTGTFRDFGVWNRIPGLEYSEGRTYPRAPATKKFTLSRTSLATTKQSTVVRHMANRFVQYTPATGLTGTWRLQVTIDMPDTARGSAAALTVHQRDGSVAVHAVPLGAHGNAVTTVSLGASTVAYVDLSLTNASTRFTCWQGDFRYSCQGTPKDDGLRTTYQAKAVR